MMTREQFTRMVQDEQEALQRFLLALCCGNTHDAHDIAQETLIRAYISRNEYDDKGRAAVWLRSIAYHLFLNHRKRAARHATVNIDTATATPCEHTADAIFQYEELHHALTFLTETERTAIVLHYMEGYKISEIAHITDHSEAAIKKQLQRGREELKHRIQR